MPVTSSKVFSSWGRYPDSTPLSHGWFRNRSDDLPPVSGSMLAFGNGRSYGDSCLNNDGHLLSCRGLDRFMQFDPEGGIIRCEAGVLIGDILELTVPAGWFVPVTPGTRLVTLGGAVANDVHGKNHHLEGSFGHHVRCLELLRSDGERVKLSLLDNPDLFRATIGGLGLTGLIVWVELQLKRIYNPWLRVETVRFCKLDDFFDLAAGADAHYEYTVAWIDCLASGSGLGRGHFMAANPAGPGCTERPPEPSNSPGIPFDLPVSLVSLPTLKVFNAMYYRKSGSGIHRGFQHYIPFFYPLDGISNWNRIYGPRGFFQYQLVVPMAVGKEAIREMLLRIAAARQGSFLSVLKIFGDRPPPGLLSFARPGVTLALDFPNLGTKTLKLLNELDAIVAEAGGAIYPAKDARMPASLFAAGYPLMEQFSGFIDPAFSSSFWRRVTGQSL